MKKIINWIKSNRRRAFALLLTLAFFLGLTLNYLANLYSTRNLVEIEKPQISNPTFDNTEIGQISVAVSLPELPKEMNIYSSESDENINSIADQMVRAFNLTPSSGAENLWIDENNKFFMSLSPISDQITLSDLQPEISFQPLEKEKSIETAKKFVSSLRLDFQTEVDEKNIELDDEHGFVYIIPFVQKINNHNLFHSNKNQSVITVYVAQDHKTIKIALNNPSMIIQEAGLARTISENKVIDDVESGKGTILFIDDGEGTAFDFNNIVNLTIDEVEIEYRDDAKNNLVIPYYKFRGATTSELGFPLVIEIIYPVVETSN